jgi:glycosyltransferase involved in cell wall biosynthesis
VPTVGRPSLAELITDLTREIGPHVASVTVVDDRPDPRPDELADLLRPLGDQAGGGTGPHRVLATGGRGPAAARNAGWRAGRSPWVVFLDDDVRLRPGWGAALAEDLAAADRGGVVGAVQGRLRVPLPDDRPPTDWERQVGGLARAPGWLTADLAVRRSVLEQIGGLDERFPRAYREDTDLELRARATGWTGTRGRRAVDHPVGPADRWTSLRRQRGNADDVLLARLHGPDWRERVGEPPGAFRRHLVTTAAGGVAAAALAARRPRLAAAAAATWAALTARFAWSRIAPGPRDRSEVAAMAATSVAIPPAAVYHRLAGRWRWRHVHPQGDRDR